MAQTDMEQIKEAWKKEEAFSKMELSEKEIQQFLQGRSGSISRLFIRGLMTDLVFKGILLFSFIGLIIILAHDPFAVYISALSIVILILGIVFQWRMMKNIPSDNPPEPVIRVSLEEKIRFYRKSYLKSLYIGALTNAFFIVSGSLYYFYSRYGEIRPFTWDDYLVFSLAVLLSFSLGAIVQIRQHNFQIGQLEECLNEIDAARFSAISLRDQRKRRQRVFLAAFLVLILGLLLFLYFLFR